MRKRPWLDVSSEPLSEQAIRSLHVPAGNYRISPSRSYEPNINFTGTFGVPTVMYLLAGCCKYTLNGDEVILHAPAFVEMEKGEFTFEVMGTESVKVVSVLELPPALRKPV